MASPPGPAPTTRGELLDAAASYAQTVDLPLDHDAIEWELSERATRRAGACRYERTTETVSIRLTWAAFEALGWETFAGIVRHELVHAWEFQRFGESGHGRRFSEKAAALDAPRHCPPFTDARLELRCRADDCEWVAERHRASKPVKHPERARCGRCGARYDVVHVESGRRWRTNDGYLDARDDVGDEW